MSPEKYEYHLTAKLSDAWKFRRPRARLDRLVIRNLVSTLRMFRQLRFDSYRAKVWREEAEAARGKLAETQQRVRWLVT